MPPQPALTEFRLLWDTLATTLPGRPKLILDRRAAGRRHLWLADPGPVEPALGRVSAPATEPVDDRNPTTEPEPSMRRRIRTNARTQHDVLLAWSCSRLRSPWSVRSFVIVDQTESVYVTEFGRPVRLIEQPGLHFKWPHQSARAFDRRLQLDTPPAREMLTRDKKNLEVAWYVSWRIADVERFLRTVRTIPDASARLEDMAASVLAAELGGSRSRRAWSTSAIARCSTR